MLSGRPEQRTQLGAGSAGEGGAGEGGAAPGDAREGSAVAGGAAEGDAREGSAVAGGAVAGDASEGGAGEGERPAPTASPAQSKSIKQGSGNKAIQSKKPTVKAAPEESPSPVVPAHSSRATHMHPAATARR